MFFKLFELWQATIFEPFDLGNVTYLKRKLSNIIFEICKEIGISIICEPSVNRGLVRVHAGRVRDEGNRHTKRVFIQLLLLNNAILRAWHHYSLNFHILKLSLFTIHYLFKKIIVFNLSALSSGRVRRTRCKISEGADAPILTRPLINVINEQDVINKQARKLPKN